MNISPTKNKRINPSWLLRRLSLQGLILKFVHYSFDGFEELRNSSDLFASAKRMWFYGGELFHEFYNNTEKNGFLPALINSLDKGGEARFIFGPALYVENKEFLAVALRSDSVKLYKRSFRDKNHYKLLEIREKEVFAIRDDPHDLNVSSDKRNSILYAQGYKNDILDLINKFKKVQSECTEITKENIFTEFIPDYSRPDDLRGFITREDENVRATLARPEQIQKLSVYLTEEGLLKKPLSLEDIRLPRPLADSAYVARSAASVVP